MKLTQSLISLLAEKAKVLGGMRFFELVSERDYLALIRNRFYKLSFAVKNLLDLNNNNFNEFEITTPRVCVKCLHEKKHYEEFQSANLVICPKHHLLLEDHCHQCRKALVFDVNLFRGICPNPRCFTRLPINSGTKEIASLLPRQVRDCIQVGVISIAIRHGDVTSQSCSEPKAEFSNGFDTLSCQHNFDKLLADIYTYLKAEYLPQHFFRNAVKGLLGGVDMNTWPVNSDAFNKPNNRELSALNSPTHMQFGEFCEYLGISKNTGKFLIRSNHIECSSGSRVTKKSVINITPFLQWLSNCQFKSAGKLLDVHSFNIHHPGFNATACDVFTAAINGKLTLSYKANTTLEDSLKFDPQDLIDYYLNNGQSEHGDTIDFKSACDVLKKSPPELELLIRNRRLIMKYEKEHGGYVLDRKQVMDYLSSNRSIHQQSLLF
ncbi:hypothetical protein [Thalassotalea sp. PS06]|uniref:hypothetical protein n=1 Tax=Thalassotalea sp. PS06 TaxID=2594005 RepID=UPI0011638D33|nr:hypothetical protein [Thalassotalea sp. PS06]QDP00231.1 hypothetical protein FNC98_02010 [Thalassotalea sp. PS06]